MGPLRVSARNGRYFARPDGTEVLLAGSHTWSNLRDNGVTDPPPTFDYDAFLDFLVARSHNVFRLWAWEQDAWAAEIAGPYWFSPGPYARPGPGFALDGKPKFDLTRFNDEYFDRLRTRVEAALRRGLYVVIVLFNGWSVEPKGPALGNPWRGHPFNVANNVNGIDGDPNADGRGTEVHLGEVPAITELQEAYVRRVVDAVNDLDNVLYEISNESGPASVAWQYHMIRYLREYEATKPKQHPIGMTVPWPGGSNATLFASPADWISPNGSIDDPPVATGVKVILSDTDHLCGICGTVAWVWKSFTRGENPMLMDGYDGEAIGLGAADYEARDPRWEAIRRNLGYARALAERLDLGGMIPRPDRCSSRYCLTDLSSGREAFVVFAPGGTVTVDLRGVPGTLAAEWLSPADGRTVAGRLVGGDALRDLSAPFPGDAVLYLRRVQAHGRAS